jgi:hypothetical protein
MSDFLICCVVCFDCFCNFETIEFETRRMHWSRYQNSEISHTSLWLSLFRRRRPLSERWYDVQSGSITIGGGAASSSADSQPSQSPSQPSHDLRALNLRWWRRSVGLVQQEPALFGVSLRDNIALGCERRPTDAEIEAAAKAANAYDFIARMPQVCLRRSMLSLSSYQDLCGCISESYSMRSSIIADLGPLSFTPRLNLNRFRFGYTDCKFCINRTGIFKSIFSPCSPPCLPSLPRRRSTR